MALLMPKGPFLILPLSLVCPVADKFMSIQQRSIAAIKAALTDQQCIVLPGGFQMDYKYSLLSAACERLNFTMFHLYADAYDKTALLGAEGFFSPPLIRPNNSERIRSKI